MWNETKQLRLDELRQRKLNALLTEEEERQLALLLEELDREDEAYLRPALQRSRQRQEELDLEIAHKQARTAAAATFAKRQAQLLARAREQLAALRGEQEALRNEYERTMREPLYTAQPEETL